MARRRSVGPSPAEQRAAKSAAAAEAKSLAAELQAPPPPVDFAPQANPAFILETVGAHPEVYARKAFEIARQAALPTGDEAIATMLRTGLVPEPNPGLDRVDRFDSVSEFVSACEEPPVCTKPLLATFEESRRAMVDDYEAKGDRSMSAVYGASCSNDWRHARYMAGGHGLGPVWEGLAQSEDLYDASIPRVSWDAVKSFWYGGWQEGIDKMRESMNRVEVPETRDIRRKGSWGTDGGELSTDRLFAGAYDTAWRTTRRRHVIAPTKVRIVVDMGSSCGACNNVAHDAEVVAAETLFWRGAAACALTETLEAAGFGVEVVCAAITRQGDYNSETQRFDAWVDAVAVTVKGMTEPAEMSILAGTTANASFFRRGFLLWQLARSRRHVDSCHGQLVRVDKGEWVAQALRLHEDGVATLIVPDWVLSAPLANAWAKAAHAGLESANDPDAAERELAEAIEMGAEGAA